MLRLCASGPPAIMGILNVTPDSFSDGGEYLSVEQALEQAQRMVDEGAEVIDIGGESTRPGAQPQSARTQIARVEPVIRCLRQNLPESVTLSIDTTSSEVASAALEAGAGLVNDVSAGRDSPDMLALVARYAVPVVLMHMQGRPSTMQDKPEYVDVRAEVLQFLLRRAELAQAAGVLKDNILIDPGIGFGKSREHNLALLAALEDLTASDYPVLLGTSRKGFMGRLCRESDPRQLLGATAATTALGVMAGVRLFRVHDVRANRQARDVAWALAKRKLK